MTRILAINWNREVLRFVHADADRQGRVRLLQSGRWPIGRDEEAAATEGVESPSVAQCSQPAARVAAIRALVSSLKAEKSRLLVLISRGSVDAAAFTLPPADETELPALVMNMALREIPGVTESTPLDFFAGRPEASGTRVACAMAMPGDGQILVQELLRQSGCRSQRILVGAHPLQVFCGTKSDSEPGCVSLVVARGEEAADLLLTCDGQPILSRTIRLEPGGNSEDVCRFLTGEVQRTLISAGGQSVRPTSVSRILLAGNEQQTAGLAAALSVQSEIEPVILRPDSFVDVTGLSADDRELVTSGDYAGLVAAILEDASGARPVIDFANPRRPQVAQGRSKRWLAAAGAAVSLVCGGWYCMDAQFRQIDDQNATLAARLSELNQLVKETQDKRRLATLLTAWEKNRICWPDELRDLTRRMPARPDLVVQQLTAAPAGNGRVVVTFRGQGSQPEVIQQMENSLRDRYHDLRIPGIREQQQGDHTTWAFQTTMTIRSRTTAQYAARQPAGPARPVAAAATAPETVRPARPGPSQELKVVPISRSETRMQPVQAERHP